MHEVLPPIGPPGPVHSKDGEAASVVTQKCVVSPAQIAFRPDTLHVGVEQFTMALAVSCPLCDPISRQLLNKVPTAVTLFAIAARHSVSVAERLMVCWSPGFCGPKRQISVWPLTSVGGGVAVGLYVRPASRTSVTTSVSRRHTPLFVTVMVQDAVPLMQLACTRGVLVTCTEGGMLNLIGQVSSSPGPSVLLPAFSVNCPLQMSKPAKRATAWKLPTRTSRPCPVAEPLAR